MTPSLASHCWGLFYFTHFKLQKRLHEKCKHSLVRTTALWTRRKHTAMADFHCYPVNASRKGNFNRGRDIIQTLAFFLQSTRRNFHQLQPF